MLQRGLDYVLVNLRIRNRRPSFLLLRGESVYHDVAGSDGWCRMKFRWCGMNVI